MSTALPLWQGKKGEGSWLQGVGYVDLYLCCECIVSEWSSFCALKPLNKPFLPQGELSSQLQEQTAFVKSPPKNAVGSPDLREAGFIIAL